LPTYKFLQREASKASFSSPVAVVVSHVAGAAALGIERDNDDTNGHQVHVERRIRK
jgi:hypothetical protein